MIKEDTASISGLHMQAQTCAQAAVHMGIHIYTNRHANECITTHVKINTDLEIIKITFLFEDVNSAFSNSATCSNNSLENKSKFKRIFIDIRLLAHKRIKKKKITRTNLSHAPEKSIRLYKTDI